MNKPRAVLISDIHFNINTLDKATKSLVQAFEYASEYKLPLIIAGDLNDTKAIMRAECVNGLLTIFEKYKFVTSYTLIGNHDLINEKGKEHTLNFLSNYTTLVEKPGLYQELDLYLFPYFSNSEELKQELSKIPEDSTIIMHQGVHGAYMGEYVQDKSSLSPNEFENFRVISGHYHRTQDIKCGRPRKAAIGLFTYIGSPYSTSFSEAQDGPKGFQLLMPNGLLTQVPVELPKHIIIKRDLTNLFEPIEGYSPGDHLWLKVSGLSTDLSKLQKQDIAEVLGLTSNFKFEKIITDTVEVVKPKQVLTNPELFDSIIDATNEDPQQKNYLKNLWRGLLDEATKDAS